MWTILLFMHGKEILWLERPDNIYIILQKCVTNNIVLYQATDNLINTWTFISTITSSATTYK